MTGTASPARKSKFTGTDNWSVPVVDAVMPDDSMLWLAADYNRNRALFASAEGYEA